MAERDRDLDRLLTFVDAVIAIAITLLVLPLVEITDELGGGSDESVRHLLSDHAPEIGAFFLSFAVIARLWMIQHRTLRHVVGHDDHLTLLLILWTLTIVFLPFPTALVAEAGDEPMTKVLYMGTMAVSTGVLAGVHLLVSRRPQLTDGEARADPAGAVATAGAMLLALAISLAVPDTSYFPLLLLALVDPVLRVVRRGR